MQPLKVLNNMQKAKLLHNLWIDEIPEFLEYLAELTETVLNDKERIANEWNSPMLGVGFWLELADQVQKAVTEYPKDLNKNASVFAGHLFAGYTAIFTVHGLMQYIALKKYTDPKFKQAVELLFT